MDFRDELLLMVWTIVQEAGGETYLGKLAVAWTVMNRVHNRSQSIPDVIFAPWQFSAWNTDSLTRRTLDTVDPKVLRDSWKAAAAAYFGLQTDPTLGATHYLNEEVTRRIRGGSLPSWFDGTKVTARIGRHTFLRP